MTINDQHIYDTIKTDPRRGFELLMARYNEPLYWHIRRLVVDHEDARDVVQETMVRVFKSIDGLSRPEALRSWMYRIATNEALRHVERHPRDRHVPIEDSDTATLMSDEYVDYSDLEAVKLTNAILALPPKQQAVFNMRYYDEMSYDEIAEATGSTPQNAKANYYHAKEKIVKVLGNST